LLSKTNHFWSIRTRAKQYFVATHRCGDLICAMRTLLDAKCLDLGATRHREVMVMSLGNQTSALLRGRYLPRLRSLSDRAVSKLRASISTLVLRQIAVTLRFSTIGNRAPTATTSCRTPWITQCWETRRTIGSRPISGPTNSAARNTYLAANSWVTPCPET
jgi:hypothetical protein